MEKKRKKKKEKKKQEKVLHKVNLRSDMEWFLPII